MHDGDEQVRTTVTSSLGYFRIINALWHLRYQVTYYELEQKHFFRAPLVPPIDFNTFASHCECRI
jgi:hypothetical protein